MAKAFGSIELINCLKKLGFTPVSQHSSHVKFVPPKDKELPSEIRPFMIVQVGRKTFDSYSANRYISQIKKFGFTKNEILKNLKKK